MEDGKQLKTMNRRNECKSLNSKLYLSVKYLLIFHAALTVLWKKCNSFCEIKALQVIGWKHNFFSVLPNKWL